MITCVGVGPGDINFLTKKALDLLCSADVVAGFDAVVQVVKPVILDSAQIINMGYKDQTKKLQTVANLHHSGKKCVVVFMGDIHFSGFQYLERVELACGHKVETIPGISSAQILASRGRVCFDETTFITFHRRGDIESFKHHLVHVLKDGRNAIIIPRPWDFMPKDIASYLINSGVSPNHQVEVWENLTKNEAQWIGNLSELNDSFSDMSIMLIRMLCPMPSQLEVSYST